MLVDLKVRHFAIIDNIQIEFKAGLNILSGETGSGKSVLLKGVALLMGEKAAPDAVKNQSEPAVIEGLFDLSDRKDIQEELEHLGIPIEDESLVVRRVVSPQGKSKVFINGTLCALTTLRDVVSPLISVTGHTTPLIEMTGQHENRNLQSKAYHLDILDKYAGCWPQRLKLTEQFTDYKESKSQLLTLQEQARTREQRLEFLKFQRDEIQQLDLTPGEEDLLEQKYICAKNYAKLSEFSNLVDSVLNSSDNAVLTQLQQLMTRSNELSRFDSTLTDKALLLKQAIELIEEFAHDIQHHTQAIESEQGSLEKIEERISVLRKLQKKYGTTVAEILQHLSSLEKEIHELESTDSQLADLQKHIGVLENILSTMAVDLHKRRTQAAILLANGVNDELSELNMKGVQLKVDITKLDDVSATGFSDVEFLISHSKKDNALPLAKVASGGELSRILLALKRVVGLSDQPRTYIFDEVDAGVSGPTAEKVGRKLKAIAKGQQVMCVTHLPQVAAFADHHLIIEKSVGKKSSHVEVRELKKADRVKEIARLISGEKITQTSLDHAKQLLADCL